MKEDPRIDELLNGFIDGELEPREQIEVQRLIAHNAQVAERLQHLQKCRMLVGSLPCATAPDEMLEEIKTSLERATLLDEQPEHFNERWGARHLMVRKVLAAAAMIGLVAVLGAVIYTIVAPESVTEKSAVGRDWLQPDRKVEADKPVPSIAVAEKPIIEADVAAAGFNGRLELKTRDLVEVDAFIKKTIEEKGLLEESDPRMQGRESVYALSCSRQTLGLLLANLENIWDRFDSATLFIETKDASGQVAIDKITAEQIAEIVNQGSFEMRMKAAKYFAALNNMIEPLPGEEVLTSIDDKGEILVSIPKPVLTSSGEAVKDQAGQAQDEQKVHLTIVVAGTE